MTSTKVLVSLAAHADTSDMQRTCENMFDAIVDDLVTCMDKQRCFFATRIRTIYSKLMEVSYMVRYAKVKKSGRSVLRLCVDRCFVCCSLRHDKQVQCLRHSQTPISACSSYFSVASLFPDAAQDTSYFSKIHFDIQFSLEYRQKHGKNIKKENASFLTSRDQLIDMLYDVFDDTRF